MHDRSLVRAVYIYGIVGIESLIQFYILNLKYTPTLQATSSIPIVLSCFTSSLCLYSYAFALLLSYKNIQKTTPMYSLFMMAAGRVGAFIDTFQGHYKDGTNGTCDYQAASSIHLIILFLIIFICMSGYLRLFVADAAQPILVTVSLFYALARPCKLYYENIIQMLLCILTAFIMSIISYSKHHRH